MDAWGRGVTEGVKGKIEIQFYTFLETLNPSLFQMLIKNACIRLGGKVLEPPNGDFRKYITS